MSWYSEGTKFDEYEPEYCKYCKADNRTYEMCKACQDRQDKKLEEDDE